MAGSVLGTVGGASASTVSDGIPNWLQDGRSVGSDSDGSEGTFKTFTHGCSDFDPLTGATDRGWLAVDTTNGQSFPTPDGGVDEGRLVRSETTDDVTIGYEVRGDIESLTARFHKQTNVGGEVELYESTDDGDSWAAVEATVSTYGGIDSGWRHYQLDADSFSDGVGAVKFVLRGGTEPWSGQLGHVSIDYRFDPAPETPDISLHSMRTYTQGATYLRFAWGHPRWQELDRFAIYLDGEQYQTLSPDSHWHPSGFVVDGLEPGTTYTVGLSAVENGRESDVTTIEATTLHRFVDDCADLSNTDPGTDVDRLTVDTTNSQYFERPDGSTDAARITRTDTDNAELTYTIPGSKQQMTVEFYRHEQHGGKLLLNGRPIESFRRGGRRRHDAGGGWIHEKHHISEVPPVQRLTITGGSKSWASQLGRVEAVYRPDQRTVTPSAPTELHTTMLSDSAVHIWWPETENTAYATVAVDGETETVASLWRGESEALLTGLSPGRHEIEVQTFSSTHAGSEPVITTVELPAEPISTFTHDCTTLNPLSRRSSLSDLTIDRSNPAYFRRPDGSRDGGRIVRAEPYDPRLVYPIPEPIASVTVELHQHTDANGWLNVSESTDEGATWSSVETTFDTYGDDDGWLNHELTATDFDEGVTHLALELTNEYDRPAWSPQLGRVEIEYEYEE